MNIRNSDKHKGVIALILLALVFASMGLFARYLATGFLLFQQVYLRMFAALLICLILFRKQIDFKKFLKVTAKDWLIIVLRAVSYSLFGIILFTQASLVTKYANVSFISALPMTALLGFLLLGEKFSLKKATYVVLAFIGVFIISVQDYSNIFTWSRGEMITLASTVFFSLSYVARRWQSDFLNNTELTVANFFVAFLAVFLVSLFKGDGLPVAGWNWGLLLAVIGAGIFNALNVFLTNYGFQKIEAVLAGNILTLEALFAVFLGFIFFGETPMPRDVLGGAFISFSVIAMNRLESEKSR
ncbi:MAG: DMT family transporter [Candidatus Brocadia sp. AMX3]|nr:DMT family transporter [Candidatus Brocadia sp. AMX3]